MKKRDKLAELFSAYSIEKPFLRMVRGSGTPTSNDTGSTTFLVGGGTQCDPDCERDTET
ncbi:MAG: hypothetical protein IPJ20_20815 [Flammeovirgaceae bacterium]|nr:hypothetical protein [Flammeovirgaceae bacterium]